jgi:hypothetical protein
LVFIFFGVVFLEFDSAGAGLASEGEGGDFVLNFNADRFGELGELPAKAHELTGAHFDESGVFGVGDSQGLGVKSQEVELEFGAFLSF